MSKNKSKLHKHNSEQTSRHELEENRKERARLKCALHTLANQFRAKGNTEAANCLIEAKKLISSDEGARKEYCFDNELVGAVAILASGGNHKRTIILVTQEENIPGYNKLLLEIFKACKEQGYLKSNETKFVVCTPLVFKATLERDAWPRRRKAVHSPETQALIYTHSEETLAESEFIGAANACDTALSANDARCQNIATEKTLKMRECVGEIIAMANGGFNDVWLRRNLETINRLIE